MIYKYYTFTNTNTNTKEIRIIGIEEAHSPVLLPTCSAHQQLASSGGAQVRKSERSNEETSLPDVDALSVCTGNQLKRF